MNEGPIRCEQKKSQHAKKMPTTSIIPYQIVKVRENIIYSIKQ
jgi:hypothetical protein